MHAHVRDEGLRKTSSTRGVLLAVLVTAVLLITLFAPSPAHTALAEDGTPSTNADSTSSGNGSIVIGCPKYSTYCYLDETGYPRGYDVEYAQEIAQYARLEPTFKLFDSATAATEALQSGEVDALVDCAKDAERERDFLFSNYPLNTTSDSIQVRSDDGRFTYGNVDDCIGKRFGAIENSTDSDRFTQWCAESGFTPDMSFYESDSQLKTALEGGQVDAVVSSYALSDSYRTIFYFDPQDSYIMFGKTGTSLKTRIDAAMGQMAAEDPFVDERLTSKYLAAKTNSTPQFTTTEKDYIAQHPTLRVAVVKDDAPYYHIENGGAKGILPEYYAVIAEKTGLGIEFVECADQATVKAAVRNGSADIVGLYGGDLTTADNEGLLRTGSYMTQAVVQVTRAGRTDEVRKIAVTQRRETILRLELTDSGQQAEIVPYANGSACYDALEAGEVDAIYLSLVSGTQLLNQHGPSKLTMSARPGISLDMSGAVLEGNYTLCSVINRTALLSKSDMESIVTANSNSSDTLQSSIEKMPAVYIILFSLLMIVLVAGLIIALVLLKRRQRERTRVLAEAAATERRQIELDAVSKSTEEKDQFFSNISHDMRTPLNAIVGFSQLAKNEHASPTVDDYLAKINESSTLLLGLINDTLSISKSGKGKLELHPTPCLNSDIFNSIVIPIQRTADDRSVILTTDRSHMPERAIMADRLNVQKIALNLLSNAIKFTPSGKHVWFTMANDPEGSPDPDTLIIVRDEGIGVSDEFLEHLYEPFSQELRTGYAGSGTGLGLAIVKQLVDLMGGTITCETEQGKGTTFTVRIHFDATDMPKAEENDPLAPIELEGHRILLCEDNTLNAEIARGLLENKGMSVTHAENGKACVEAFSNSKPGTFDAILMDVRMPVMDGLTASRTIRALDRADSGTVPIIAMTADAFDEDIKRCLDAGMDAHVAKPIDPEDLFVSLGAYIARRESASKE